MCGLITTVNNDRKNSVALGFRPLVMKPATNAARGVRSTVEACTASLPGAAGPARNALKPMYSR
ncbi:hypothetical protein D3C72_2025460 [compost metagenome]